MSIQSNLSSKFKNQNFSQSKTKPNFVFEELHNVQDNDNEDYNCPPDDESGAQFYDVEQFSSSQEEENFYVEASEQ